VTQDLGFRRTVIAIDQQSFSASCPHESFVKACSGGFSAQPELFRATAAIMLSIA